MTALIRLSSENQSSNKFPATMPATEFYNPFSISLRPKEQFTLTIYKEFATQGQACEH